MNLEPGKSAIRLLKTLLARPRKVFCLGFGKTGTTTFAEAMRTLGHRHLSQGIGFAYQHGYRLPVWWKLNRYDSFDDFPWPFLFEYLDKKLPNSKFVLTTRSSSEVWIESLCKHFDRVGSVRNNRMFYGYSTPYENIEHHIKLYEGHNERVRRHFRGRPNFLEICWEHGHGWTELCGFLQKQIPTSEFPHANRAPSDAKFSIVTLEDRRLSDSRP